jgi:hypothetical protein
MATFEEFLRNYWRITVGLMQKNFAVETLKIEITNYEEEYADLSHI